MKQGLPGKNKNVKLSTLPGTLSIRSVSAEALLDAKSYFRSQELVGNKLKNGVVETPEYIADVMVTLALKKYFERDFAQITFEDLNHLSWLDPSVGAGIFPRAIIKKYFDKKPTLKSASDLPCLTITDISQLGMEIALKTISNLIKDYSITLEEYINSGRLKFSVGDALLTHASSTPLLNHSEEFDVVITNPPYVRASRLDAAYREFLRNQFPYAYRGSADLYTYFIALGISCLKQGGILAYISPAGFLRTSSGSNIRSYIKETCAITSFIDLDEKQVFENADLHSSIYTLKRGSNQPNKIDYLHVDSSESLNQLATGNLPLEEALVNLPKDLSWSFFSLKNKKSKAPQSFHNCVPLISLGITVYSGIRTGFSAAFIRHEAELSAIPSAIRATWLKPLVLPSNIIRWKGAKHISQLIFIPNDKSPPPEIVECMSSFKERLETRPEVNEKARSVEWYQLRPCGYYEKMYKRKIVFPDLSAKQRFSLSDQGTLVSDGAYFIDTDDLALLGVLNSKVAEEYFIHNCASVGTLGAGGRFRFKKSYVQRFPLPSNFLEQTPLRATIENTVQSILDEGETKERLSMLNSLVEELYKNA